MLAQDVQLQLIGPPVAVVPPPPTCLMIPLENGHLLSPFVVLGDVPGCVCSAIFYQLSVCADRFFKKKPHRGVPPDQDSMIRQSV
jgi:hypothetical protein